MPEHDIEIPPGIRPVHAERGKQEREQSAARVKAGGSAEWHAKLRSIFEAEGMQSPQSDSAATTVAAAP